MKVIRQLLIAWILVAVLVLQAFDKDEKTPHPPRESPHIDWTVFTYNSPEEKAFWDKLPDWSGKEAANSNPFLPIHFRIEFKRNAQGEIIDSNSSEGYSGYVKSKSGSMRTIYQFVDGYAIRSKSWREDGRKWQEHNYKEGKQDGLSTTWHKNEQKIQEGNYKGGKKDGLWTYWHKNGQKELELNYKDGKRDGLQTAWYKYGQKRGEGNLKDGKMDGLWTEWYQHGQTSIEANFKNGKSDGLSIEWYENGKKKEKLNYKDGKRDGPWIRWYENGQKEGEGSYKDGKLLTVTSWKPNGEECPVTNVKDGDGVWLSYRIDDTKVYSTIYNNGFGFKQTVLNPQPEGIDEDKLQKRGKEGEELSYAPNEQAPYTGWAKSIYDNGQIKDLRHFKDGKYDGLATHWYQHGQKESEANYKDGTKDGPSTYWYVNGQKAAVGNFKDGKRNGLWAGWYENGQKEGECSFKAGKLVTANTWKPNGEMCTVTNLKDGNGVIVEYNEDGTENNRAIFKDGLPN